MNYTQMSQISAHQALSLVKKCGPTCLELTIGFESNIAKNEVP